MEFFFPGGILLKNFSKTNQLTADLHATLGSFVCVVNFGFFSHDVIDRPYSASVRTYVLLSMYANVTSIILVYSIINNYSPKWSWLAVDIYRAAKRRGKYPTLTTDTEVNSCFSIY